MERPGPGEGPLTYGLAIEDARVVDGTGSPWFRGTIGVDGAGGGQIAAASRKSDPRFAAEQTIDADRVVFDPGTVGPPATFDEPKRSPRGIERVLVDGTFAVGDGDRTGETPGEATGARNRTRGENGSRCA